MIRNLLLAILITSSSSWGASVDARRVSDQLPWSNNEPLVVTAASSTSADFVGETAANSPWYRLTGFVISAPGGRVECQANQITAPYCSYPFTPWHLTPGCTSAQQASELFNSLVGTIMYYRNTSPDGPYTWGFACAAGNKSYRLQGGLNFKPTPPSCVASSAHIAMEGLVRQNGISGSADIRVQCTAPADVVLSVANAGHLNMGGELDVRVTLPGGLDNIRITDLLDRSIKVTASVTSPPMVAGTFSGSTVVTIAIE